MNMHNLPSITCLTILVTPIFAQAQTSDLYTNLVKGFSIGWVISLIAFIFTLRLLTRKFGDKISLGQKIICLLLLKFLIIGSAVGISYWNYQQSILK